MKTSTSNICICGKTKEKHTLYRGNWFCDKNVISSKMFKPRLEDDSCQGKKENNLSLGDSLETQNNIGGEDTKTMPIIVDNHPDTLSRLRSEIERAEKLIKENTSYRLKKFWSIELDKLKAKLSQHQQDVLEFERIVDNWASNSILKFDDDSIAQTKIIEDITRYVKELKTSLREKEVKGNFTSPTFPVSEVEKIGRGEE